MAAIRRFARQIAERFHPDKIILFGSYAYGQPHAESDVDLLVIMNTKASHKDRSWAVSRLLLPRPFPVDILVKTPREVREGLETGDFVLREILSRGKVLYDRSE